MSLFLWFIYIFNGLWYIHIYNNIIKYKYILNTNLEFDNAKLRQGH